MTEHSDVGRGEILHYQTDDGRTRVECRFADETLWLSQAGMAELFQSTKRNIAKHLKAIFSEGELDSNSVVNQELTTEFDIGRCSETYHDFYAVSEIGYVSHE